MARSYAPIYTSIWQDETFTALSVEAQRLFFLINSQPDISHCGVIVLNERRWAKWASNTSVEAIRSALGQLHAARFVLLDEGTDEVLVRSYMAHNKVLAQPKINVAAANQWPGIHSTRLRRTIAEWVRAHVTEDREKPWCKAIDWLSDSPCDGQAIADGIAEANPMASPYVQVQVRSNALPTDEPEPEPEDQTSTVGQTEAVADEEDSGSTSIAQRLDATWRLLADRALARRSGDPVRDVDAWMRAAVAGSEAQHRAKAEELLAFEPNLTAEQLADRLEPSKPRATQDDPVASTRAAHDVRAREAAEQREAEQEIPQDFAGGAARFRALREGLMGVASPSEPESNTEASTACRLCGCTDDEACEGGCAWVDDPAEIGALCSKCFDRAYPIDLADDLEEAVL
jgi:hypothetical protein